MARDGFEVEFTGDLVDKLEQLGRDFKAAGEKDLRKELMRAGQRITKPVKENIKAHAISDLPHKGGLNTWVASKMKIQTQVRLTGKNVGIRFKTRHKGERGLSDLPSINDGTARHPLFGETDHWYNTKVEPGFVTRAVEEMAEDVRAEFLAAVDEIAARFYAGG